MSAPAAAGVGPGSGAVRRLLEAAPGLLLCAGLALAAMWLANLPWLREHTHVSALLLVILLGMAWRTLLPLPAAVSAGVSVAQRPVLRWAVAGLGFRLSFTELARIGGPALAVVVISTVAALVFGWWLARRVGIGDKLGLLLGVGGAICGASAVVAADTVVQGERRDSALALAVITLLGTVGIVVYPVLGRLLGMSDLVYGVWDGASLHEMAQVVAAGFGHSESAAQVATVVKLARIALLAPVVLFLSWWMRRRHVAAGQAQVAPVPWFLVVFVVFVGVNSAAVVPADVVKRITTVVLGLLCVGMAGVGLQTGLADLRSAGLKPILVGSGQWLLLSVLSYGLAVALCR